MAKILVVDDVAENRDLVVMLMRYAQHEALEAEDGEQALALVRAHHPDLVICDILMPMMDGYAFVRALRSEPLIADTKVIFYTATFLEKEASLLASACGVTQVLTKPCEPEEILRVVDLALSTPQRPLVQVPPASANDFDRDHLRLVSDKLVAKALALEEANQRLAALTELAMQLASEREPTALLTKFCQGVRVLFGARGAILSVRDKNEAGKVHFAVAGLSNEERSRLTEMPLDAETAEDILRQRIPLRFQPGSGSAPMRFAVTRALPEARSALVVPVVSLHHNYGWIMLVDKLDEAGFPQEDAHTLAVQAAQTGRIYENGSLYAQVQRQLGQLQAQTAEREHADALLRLDHAVALALAASDDIKQGLRSVLRTVCESQGWELGRYWQVDEAAQVLRLAMVWSPRGRLSAHFMERLEDDRVRRPGEGLAGAVWQSGQALWVRDIRHEREATPKMRNAEGLRCANLFPVFDASRTIGVLSFLSEEAREPDARLQAAGKTIANQLGQFLQRREAEAALRASERFARSTLDSLSEHICVLDKDGVIVATNLAWRAFAEENGGSAPTVAEGVNYLSVCDRTAATSTPEAALVGQGIREVLSGRQSTFSIKYQCDSPTQHRWFLTRVSRFSGAGPVRVVVSHENITLSQQAEERIQRLHRVTTVMSDINALIARVPSRDELFREACRISIHTGHFKKSWIGLLDHAPWRLDVVAQCDDGTAEGYFDLMFASLRAHIEAGGAIFESLLLRGETIVENDIASSTWMMERELALSTGSRSLAALPLIVDKQTAGVLVLHAGETDFFDAQEMRLLKELANDISFAMNHIAQSEKLNRLAYYDGLTGQANAMLFNERLSQMVAATVEKQACLALAIIDIERFKAINDSLGRHTGDAVLREVAGRIALAAADATRMARLGADQFAVVFTDAGAEYEIARMLQEFYQRVFGESFLIGGEVMRLTAKIGIALCPDDGASAETLHLNAEAALKRAKTQPERLSFYDARMAASIAEKLALEASLREALALDRFVLHYQPKVDTVTRRIEGVEALIRWQDPERGLVPPARFIPLLEETGLIAEVGAWALERAVRDRIQWASYGLAAPRVAVNVSAVQLRKPDFVATVERALQPGGLDPGIDLEITESATMINIEDTIVKLKTLHAAGVDLAIDDFGTGYSSLAYLAKLPVQVLKIDRAFIMTMHDNPANMTLVATMVSLGHALGLKVVAEGVETEIEAAHLRQLGCDQLQGYLISRPLPPQDLLAMLKSHIDINATNK